MKDSGIKKPGGHFVILGEKEREGERARKKTKTRNLTGRIQMNIDFFPSFIIRYP